MDMHPELGCAVSCFVLSCRCVINAVQIRPWIRTYILAYTYRHTYVVRVWPWMCTYILTYTYKHTYAHNYGFAHNVFFLWLKVYVRQVAPLSFSYWTQKCNWLFLHSVCGLWYGTLLPLRKEHKSRFAPGIHNTIGYLIQIHHGTPSVYRPSQSVW